MQTYIDIHSHILPGVDDGAQDLEMSIRMLCLASENGIGKIILTPHNKPMHHNFGPKKMRILSEQLEKEMRRKGLEIELYIGNEIYYRSDILELLEEEKACTMAGSTYVLVEFGPMDDYDYIRSGIYRLTSGGYQPILAHVERYGSICSHTGRVEELVKLGGYIQVNAGSVMGQYGYQAKYFTRRLLKQQMVHFVATDAHNDEKRGPYLLDCAKYIDKKYGGEYAQRIFWDNPEHVIAGEYI